MRQALHRFGISQKAEAAVASLYSKPVFLVQGFDLTTTQGTVAAGIRQGCPPKPLPLHHCALGNPYRYGPQLACAGPALQHLVRR